MRALAGVFMLLTACSAQTASVQAECEAQGGVYHEEREECFGADGAESLAAATGTVEPTPSPTTDTGSVAREYAEHVAGARDDFLEIFTSGSEADLYVTFTSAVSFAEEELAWLEEQPDIACLDDAHRTYRAALRSTLDFAQSARDAVTSADLVTLEMLSDQAYEIGVSIGDAAEDAVGAGISC